MPDIQREPEHCPICNSDQRTDRGIIETERTGGPGRVNLERSRSWCADPWHEPAAPAQPVPPICIHCRDGSHSSCCLVLCGDKTYNAAEKSSGPQKPGSGAK